MTSVVVALQQPSCFLRHCEERSDAAIRIHKHLTDCHGFRGAPQ